MANMGRYCKAYYVKRFREFPGWTERPGSLRPGRRIDGKENGAGIRLGDDDFLYLQETYTVTDGVFLDQNIVFDNVNPEWVEFCKDQLGFEVPSYD